MKQERFLAFLHHFLIIINIVWMIFAFDMKPSIEGVFSTVVLLNILAVPIGLINILIDKLGFGYANCPKTDAFFNSMVSFPFHHSLSDTEVDLVISASRQTLDALRGS